MDHQHSPRSLYHSPRSSLPTPPQTPKVQQINHPEWVMTHAIISMTSLFDLCRIIILHRKIGNTKKCLGEINSKSTRKRRNLCQSFYLMIRKGINLLVASHARSLLIIVHSYGWAKQDMRFHLKSAKKFLSVNSHQSFSRTFHRMIVHLKKRLWLVSHCSKISKWVKNRKVRLWNGQGQDQGETQPTRGKSF